MPQRRPPRLRQALDQGRPPAAAIHLVADPLRHHRRPRGAAGRGAGQPKGPAVQGDTRKRLTARLTGLPMNRSLLLAFLWGLVAVALLSVRVRSSISDTTPRI